MSRPRLLFSLILLIETAALLAALWVLVIRHRVETANRTVQVVVDYDEVAVLAARSGLPLPRALQAARDLGVTGVGIQEDTLESLLDRGLVSIASRTPERARSDTLAVLRGDSDTLRRIASNLGVKRTMSAPQYTWELLLPAPVSALERIGIGWDPQRFAFLDEIALKPVARPVDTPLITERGLRQTFDQATAAGMQEVLFSGKSVLGYPGLLDQTAQYMRDRHLEFCALDLDIQKGTARLAGALQGQVIRTHSISEGEMLKQTPDRARARFLRAVRERNVRCLFVRLFLDQAVGDPWTYNMEYVSGLVSDLKASGFALGPARPVPLFNERHFLAPLIAIGVAGAGVELLALLFELSAVTWWLLWLAGSLVLAGAAQVKPSPALPFIALLAAVIYPTLGLARVRYDLILAGKDEGPTLHAPRPTLHALYAGLWAWLRASAFAVTGGILVAGLLSSTSYMLQVDEFRGVKLAQLLPLLAVTFLYLGEGLARTERPALWWGRAWRKWRDHLGHPMTIGIFCLLILAAGVAGLWILRTGNQPGLAPGKAEMTFRRMLEHLLIYRPRTKEFLLGHPALILAGVAAARGWARSVWPLLIIGVIGQVSVVNSFCHIHSPIDGAGLRTLYGLILGALVGAVLALIVFGWKACAREGEERAE